MNLLPHIGALSQPIDALQGAIGDVARIALFLSFAYLAYGIAHILVDHFENKEKQPFRFLRRVCRAVIYALIMLIAALHALEYLLDVASTA